MNYNQGKGNCKNTHVKMNSDSHLLKPASIRSFRNIFFSPMQCVSDRSWMLCRPVPGWHLLYSELQQSISAQGCGSAQAGCEDAGTLLLGKTLLPNATLAPGLDCPSISQLRESRSSCSQGEDAALLGSSGLQFRRSQMQFLEHHCSASRWHCAFCCLLGTTAPRFQAMYLHICV